MAGHSKWSKIKRQKAADDKAKGRLFSKLGREIAVAAREGGGDPDFNPRLRSAIDAAKAENMPAVNIDRAIKRGTGDLPGMAFEEAVYEGYGPGGAALMIFTLTDNPNRTVADLRHKLSRHGGNLGAANSVAWMFERKGQIYLDGSKYAEETALEAALEAGAEDFARDDEQFTITTDPTEVHSVKTALEERGIEPRETEIAFIPKSTVHVEGKDAEALLKLLDEIEELDDVQKVASNFDVDMEQLAHA